MNKNLELKAKISSISYAVHLAKKLGAVYQGILKQKDIYYKINSGRLKLRIINLRSAELIFYKRPDRKFNRYSNYDILKISDIENSKFFFARIYGIKRVVEKKRFLFIYENSRIHIDKVKGLGNFIEFEVLVRRGKKQANEIMQLLISYFNIKKENIIPYSYSDL